MPMERPCRRLFFTSGHARVAYEPPDTCLPSPGRSPAGGRAGAQRRTAPVGGGFGDAAAMDDLMSLRRPLALRNREAVRKAFLEEVKAAPGFL